MSIEVLTFGCRLNARESDRLAAEAAAEELGAATIVNTCAVTGEAVRQARQAIRKARRDRPDARLIVTGCAAQIEPRAFAAMREVDLVLGAHEKLAPGALSSAGARVRVGDVFRPLSEALEPTAAAPQAARRARAYVEAQNGCDHRCTFCVIPYGRGNSRSRLPERVVDETRALASAGFAEVVLTGVDLTSWGADLPARPTLGALVGMILDEVPGLARLRLSSIDAAEIDDALLDRFGREPRLAPHLHLSLQSGDDLILKRMKRRHCASDALRLIADVRAARPETAFGADLIAGFPTESEAAFENTIAFVDAADLAYLHVFPFSPRPGTPAARMPQLPRPVVSERAGRLRAAGATALARRLERQIGRTVEGLVERPGRARAPDFAEIAFSGEARIGAMAQLRIFAHDGRRAIGALA